ncbi:MAG: leucyl aminopeptidase [Bacteroidota bacterium]
MIFTLSHKKPEVVDVGVSAIFLFENSDFQKEQILQISPNLQKKIANVIRLQKFKGEAKEIITFFSDEESISPRISIIGLGKKEIFSNEIIRRVSSKIANEAQKLKSKSLAISIPLIEEVNFSTQLLAQSFVEGILLGLYSYDKYKTKKINDKLESVLFLLNESTHIVEFQNGVERGEIISKGVIVARNLSNAPGNEIYPKTLAEQTERYAREANFKIKILNERKISSLKMGGVIAVSKGSDKPARFIILEHGSKYKYKGTIALVGKGVTFDSGGISIKPSNGMAEMKMDMSGAAAVIGTFYSIAKLKIPMHVVGLIPSVENMPSGNSLKPGDIITHLNGKTSEVDNTDAEGRLILADALSYAEKFKPDIVIDLATLTGACVVALGQHASGLMGNDKILNDSLKNIGDETFERLCELPLYEEYESQIKSDIADVKNVGGKWAGAITAALFLKKFIGNYKWAHLDIAGTAILEENFDYAKRGGSGVGVRLLTSFIEKWKK